MIDKGDDLLVPRFYLEQGMAGWLEGTVRHWMADRPNCVG